MVVVYDELLDFETQLFLLFVRSRKIVLLCIQPLSAVYILATSYHPFTSVRFTKTNIVSLGYEVIILADESGPDRRLALTE